MRKPSLLLFASVLLLSSCSLNPRDDVFYFIKDWSMDSIRTAYRKGKVSYVGKTTENDKIKESSVHEFSFDFTDETNFQADYSVTKESPDEEGNLVTVKTDETIRTDTSHEGTYLYEKKVDGKVVDTQKMNAAESFAKVEPFYSTYSPMEHLYTGGMYYGDQVKLSLKYQSLMTVDHEANILTFDTGNLVDGDGTHLRTFYRLNSDGMVLYSHNVQYNDTIHSDMLLTCEY